MKALIFFIMLGGVALAQTYGGFGYKNPYAPGGLYQNSSINPQPVSQFGTGYQSGQQQALPPPQGQRQGSGGPEYAYSRAYRVVAQYGAEHTAIVPYNQQSQRGVAGRVIVPNSQLNDWPVMPSPQKWVVPIDPDNLPSSFNRKIYRSSR